MPEPKITDRDCYPATTPIFTQGFNPDGVFSWRKTTYFHIDPVIRTIIPSCGGITLPYFHAVEQNPGPTNGTITLHLDTYCRIGIPGCGLFPITRNPQNPAVAPLGSTAAEG